MFMLSFRCVACFCFPYFLCQEIRSFQPIERFGEILQEFRSIQVRLPHPHCLWSKGFTWRISVSCWMVCNLEMFQPSPDAKFQGRFQNSTNETNPWVLRVDTPLKINMEPKNHPIEEENHLPNLHFDPFWGSMLIFGGVILQTLTCPPEQYWLEDYIPFEMAPF